jgi:N6-adenosine-specific RNA methylase IME4
MQREPKPSCMSVSTNLYLMSSAFNSGSPSPSGSLSAASTCSNMSSAGSVRTLSSGEETLVSSSGTNVVGGTTKKPHEPSAGKAPAASSGRQNQTNGSGSGGEGGAAEHNFGNDYCDHYLRSGVLPQSHIRNIVQPLTGYPKLQRLHELKQTHNRKHAGKAFGRQVAPEDMADELSKWTNHSGNLNFDVVMVNGCLDNYPDYDTLVNLPIQKITPRPSILLLWVPGPALELGRAVLEHWGFRRSEDIVYFVTDSQSLHFPQGAAKSPQDSITKSTWHCLMGLKGTLRRSEDSDLINCNIDTDVILETSSERPNVVPEAIYHTIENFALMNRRIHIIPSYSTFEKPVRPRPGWVIMSPDILLDNFDSQTYTEQAKSLGYRVPVDHEIDSLRPKTPPKMKRNHNNNK